MLLENLSYSSYAMAEASSATPSLWAAPESVASAPVSEALTAQDDPVVLITKVDLGDGRQAAISIHESDLDATHHIAQRFVLQHGLPQEAVAPLSTHLAQQVDKAVKVCVCGGACSR